MKKAEIKQVLDALKTLKMPKIADKELRNIIIKNHLKLLGEQKKFHLQADDLVTAFMSAYEPEQNVVVTLEAKLRSEKDADKQKELIAEIETHKDYLEAVKACNDEINALGREKVEIELIDGEKFVEAYQEQDEFSLATVEALYPMFK